MKFAGWLILLFCSIAGRSEKATTVFTFFPASDPAIQYNGRIDFSNPELPRFWQPGVYITIKFKGTACDVIINDENLWGKNHNYVEIVVDGVEKRLQTKAARDTIHAAEGLGDGPHTLIIMKNTEANIGYLELVGFLCEQLLPPPPVSQRLIEFIGDSITCGASSDESSVPCGKGVWHDQHNAWLSYGARTGRALNARYHLSSVSGIGLMHSCCNMDIIMPQVFDKVSMRDNKIPWNFSKLQPDVVTVCLGQNDGIQDSATFCNNYVSFLKTLRTYYPHAMIVCLSSPMADPRLASFMKKALTAVVEQIKKAGDKRIAEYFFSKQYSKGCDWHPSIEEHNEIANELVTFVRKTMKW